MGYWQLRVAIVNLTLTLHVVRSGNRARYEPRPAPHHPVVDGPEGVTLLVSECKRGGNRPAQRGQSHRRVSPAQREYRQRREAGCPRSRRVARSSTLGRSQTR